MGMKQIILPVEGMTCASCVNTIEKALSNLQGVKSAEVNLTAGKAHVEYADDKLAVPEMVKAIEDVGYHIGKEEITLSVHGMTCASCVSKVEKAVGQLPGVTNVVVQSDGDWTLNST